MKKKKSKKTLYVTLTIIAIILLLFFIRVPNQTQTNLNQTSTGGYVGGGGGGGSSSAPTTSTPLLLVPLSWFNFNTPIIPEIPAIIIPQSIIPTSTPLKADGGPCTQDSQCQSNNCNLGNYAVGVCEAPVQRTTTTERTLLPTLKSNGDSCTDDTQCTSNFCDLGNYAIGTCKDPVARTTTFSCSDYKRERLYANYYTGVISRGSTCQSYAESQCIGSRYVQSYQVLGEDCCVWNC